MTLTTTQVAVLDTIFNTGAISDNDLQYAIKSKRNHTSWSGIRTRRSELTRLGLVKQVGTGTSTSGRKEALWDLTDAGFEAAIVGFRMPAFA